MSKAENLRSRHPQAALGFVYSLSYTAFNAEHRRIADWIVDLLGKLGREDDAYDAVALIVPGLAGVGAIPVDEDADDEKPLVAAGIEETARSTSTRKPGDAGRPRRHEYVHRQHQGGQVLRSGPPGR